MTYGTLEFVPPTKVPARWRINCQPHVAIRLKRVFPRIETYRKGDLLLSDTVENARDLAWFIERYPLQTDKYSREVLDSRQAQHRETEALVNKLLSGQQATLSFELAKPLREYQKQAVALTLALKSLLLADDVGLGKTASAIGVISDPSARPALVVTLTHLPRQWEQEIAKFAPELRTHVVKRGTPYDIRFLGSLPDVILMNYHKLGGWAETLAPLIKSVIFDEVQELRHAKKNSAERTQKYGAAEMVSGAASIRMGLSATPIYNYGGEFFNVMNVISPDALGAEEEFRREWCDYSWDKPRISDSKAFGTYMRSSGLMLRRTREEVGRELPDVIRIPHTVEANEAALNEVGDACAELARLILARGENFKGQKMQASEELSNRLRQATGIAKAPYVAEFVRMLIENGERVVLYGWHREVYSIWMDRLKEFHPVMFTGSESPAQKEQAKLAFLSGATPLLIMSLRSGAGLDGLQERCNVVCFGELDWSPGVHEQCIGRIHRDGQTNKVVAYYLVADSGADPIIMDVLGVKREQVEGIRNPDREILEKLQVDGGHIKRLAAAYLESRNEKVAEVSA